MYLISKLAIGLGVALLAACDGNNNNAGGSTAPADVTLEQQVLSGEQCPARQYTGYARGGGG